MSRKKYINLNFSEIIFRIKKYKNIKNDIRHFYITYALANGAGILELAERVGHVDGPP